jgi:hypothetical protein
MQTHKSEGKLGSHFGLYLPTTLEDTSPSKHSNQQPDPTLEALRRVLEERQLKKLHHGCFGSSGHDHEARHQRRSKYSQEKYKHLQSYEEKTFYKLQPTKEIKEVLTDEKATELFENYNREREYMSRSRSRGSSLRTSITP